MGKKATITAWLRKRFSHLDYGYKWCGGIVHCNTNDEVLDHLRNKTKLSHLTNEKLGRHFSGEDTFYFAGNSWGEQTLVMVDIDCHHGIGNLDGALSYAKFLKDTLFPSLYYEPSTNGHGAHGYFVLAKAGVSPEEVNALLGQLQAYLRQTIMGFNIETVEIKGRCPVIVWGRKRGEVANYKAGVLAKIPRQADRFDELKNTTVLTIQQLRAMVCKQTVYSANRVSRPIVEFPIVRIPTVSTTVKVVPAASPTISIPKVREAKAVGSCSDRVISQAELEKLNGHYLKVAETLMGTHTIRTGRVAATPLDLAILLMLLRWFTGDMNQDGSLPWKRFKGLWDALYKAGDIIRAYDPKRFAALRNYLSSLELLDWQDNKYHLGHWSNGVKVSGKACAWKAGKVLMEMLKSDNGEKKREEETSLAGTSASSPLQQLVESLEMKPFDLTIRPIWTIPMPFIMPTEQELEKAMGWAA